jgi:hypothetical protein
MSSPARKVQYNATRPTSVVVMTLLFEGVQLLFPDAMSQVRWWEYTRFCLR